MRKLNTAVISAILMLLATPTVVNAGSWICESNNLIREISVERETANAAPCSVVYNKDSENQGSKVLWSASFDGSYCDSKADALADKLASYGWSCTSF
ncbi:MAG: hypothetical protein AAF353_16915 [Pseudomonadota bacterium]